MTPDPPWQPKVGDVVAVEFRVNDTQREGILGIDPAGMTDGPVVKWSVGINHIAPWLPAEDHAALLRLRDAALAMALVTDDHYADIDGDCWSCGERFPCVTSQYGAALAATEHIR